MNYYLTYKRNNIFHGIMIDAPALKIAEQYFQNINPKARLISGREATPGDWKPGMPMLTITPIEAKVLREQFLSCEIDVLDLSVRSYNCLRRAGIDTVGKLIEKTGDELMAIRNLGWKCHDEIINVLKEYGETITPAYKNLVETNHSDAVPEMSGSDIQPESERLMPYRVILKETYVKEVEVYAAAPASAQKIADGLWSNGKICVDYDNFADRSTSCRGLARPIDLELHDVYGREYTSFIKEETKVDFVSEDFDNLPFAEQLKVAAAIEYKGIIFDDWQVDNDAVWAEICESCVDDYKDLISGELDDGSAIGVCSVSGCNVSGLESDNKHYYIDFQPEFIHPLSKEQYEELKSTSGKSKMSLDERVSLAAAQTLGLADNSRMMVKEVEMDL